MKKILVACLMTLGLTFAIGSVDAATAVKATPRGTKIVKVIKPPKSAKVIKPGVALEAQVRKFKRVPARITLRVPAYKGISAPKKAAKVTRAKSK